MVTLKIDDKTFAFWVQRAAAHGLSIEDWLKAETVDRQTTDAASQNSDAGYDADMPQDAWAAALEAIAKRHRPTGMPLDDGRESMYD